MSHDTMHTEQLVKMANQIASFFATYPDQHQAAVDTAAHIRKFWAPAMRSALIAYVHDASAADLQPLAKNAVALLETGK